MHFHIVLLLRIIFDPLVVEGGAHVSLRIARGAQSVRSRSYADMYTDTGRVYTHQGASGITLK